MPSLRALFRRLVSPDADGWSENQAGVSRLGLVVILDADSLRVSRVPGIEMDAVLDRLATLSESPRIRVGVIRDGVHRLVRRDYTKIEAPSSDRRALAITLAREIKCVRRVVLYICGPLRSPPLRVGGRYGQAASVRNATTLRIGRRRYGADYVLPSPRALARFVEFLATQIFFETQFAVEQRERRRPTEVVDDIERITERAGFVSRLEPSRTSKVPVELGPEREHALLWRDMGRRRSILHLVPEQLHVRLDDGTEFASEADDLFSAFRQLDRDLSERDRWLYACGNCELFTFHKGMAGKWGRCAAPATRPEVVSILDVCDLFRYGPTPVPPADGKVTLWPTFER